MSVIEEALFILFFGISAVFISIFFFFLLIFVLKKVDEKINEIRVNRKLKSGELSENANVLTPELVAVISAAVFEVINKPVHIRKIKFLKDQKSGSWTALGRINIMGSHAIRISRTKI